MTNIITKASLLFIVLVLPVFMLFQSCDSMEEDALPGNPQVSIEGGEVYVLPNGTAYIDLYSKVQTNGKITLNVSSQPSKGNLSQVGTGLLKYTPSSGFLKGKDRFAFSVFSEVNELIRTDSVIIVVGDTTQVPCGIYPADDSVYTNTSSIEVDVLRNDLICGDSSDIILEIYKPGNDFPPHRGNASVTSANKIRYVSSSSEVRDTVVYKVTRASDRSVYGFGTLFINGSKGCIPELSDILAADSVGYPFKDSLQIFVKPSGPVCGFDYADTLSIVKAPKNGEAVVGKDWLWYVYQVTENKKSIRDSLRYRWCNNGNCLDGKVMIRIN